MRLFLAITTIECYYFCSYVMAWDPINSFQYKMFAATVFFQTGNWQKNYEAAYVLYKSALFQLHVLVWVPLMLLNICVCIDLIYLVRRPFSQHQKRIPWYILLTVVGSAVDAYFALIAFKTNYGKSYLIWLEFVEYGAVILFAILSISIASYRLCQPGVSEKTR